MNKISTVIILLIFCLSSCVEGEREEPKDLERVLLIYCAGDNSLSSSLASIAEEIRKGWEYTGNRCLIYYDAVDDVPKLLSIRGGCCETPTPYIEVVESYEEENSTSPEVFARVIHRVKEQHPAPSYGLIFTSHGSGWLPEGALQNPTRSIGQDKDLGTTASGSSEMEISDFVKAIPGDITFDYIIFEACLMAGIEVAYELKDKANYILASSAELLVPGFKDVYSIAHRYLMNNNLSTSAALSSFARDYYDHILELDLGLVYQSTTLSIIKTADLEKLAEISANILAREGEMKVDINSLQHFDRPGIYGDYPVSPKYFDMEEYIENIATPDEFEEFTGQLSKAVIWKEASPTFMIGAGGFPIKRHCGLTIYIPQALFPKLNEAYKHTAWSKRIQTN